METFEKALLGINIGFLVLGIINLNFISVLLHGSIIAFMIYSRKSNS
jgi:hypothetical protein